MIAEQDTTAIAETARKLRENIQKVIIGKDEIIDLALIAMLTGGHLLLEDVPGTGKTTLAKTIAASLGCTFRHHRHLLLQPKEAGI